MASPTQDGIAPSQLKATSSDRTALDQQALKRLVLWGLILACVTVVTGNRAAEPDLWGHVRFGQDILELGQLSPTASHSFTAAQQPWINHEVLSEVVFAIVYSYLGVPGLLGMKCIVVMAIFGLMAYVAMREDVSPIVFWSFSLIIAANLVLFSTVRPQIFSFLAFSLMLFLLEIAFQSWHLVLRGDNQVSCSWLWLLPLVFAIWVNFHGGFVAGLCVLFAYLVGRSIEAVFYLREKAWIHILKFALLALACALASLANPYGLTLHHWLATSLLQPRPEVSEWNPPTPESTTFAPWICLLVTIVVVVTTTRRQLDTTKLLVIALAIWQSSCHLRHIALLGLMCGFWLPPHVQSVLQRFSRSRGFKLFDRLYEFIPSRLLAFAIAVMLGAGAYMLVHSLSRIPVYGDEYPVDAVHFAAANKIDGKMVVAFNWAQYVIAALAPEVQVAFDGRYDTCYPYSVVDMHFDFMVGDNGGLRHRQASSGKIDSTKSLEFGTPDLVLIDRQFAYSEQVMESEAKSEWVLLYQDKTAQLWGRAVVYDDPASSRYVNPRLRIVSNVVSLSHVSWPGLP